MAETTSAMDIDDAPPPILSKGKAVISPSDGKSAPWVEKYRPQSLADVAAHRDIVDTIDRLTNENRLPHLLLYGPPGTGKTSTILALARKLYGSQYQNMILELNASDDRGIDVVRQQIQDFASARSLSFGLDVAESGLTALVRLCNGDMRKALNILQSTHMASQHITEEAVYLCTGNPMPKDIEQIAFWLLNESFTDSFKYISETKMRKGLALVDIVREVTMFVFKIKMPSDVRVKLINDLADIEYRLSFGCNDKLQLGSLISTFTTARCALVAATQ